jgi:hypothetical protein
LEILTDKNLAKHQELKELLSPDFINIAFRKTQRHLTVADTGYARCPSYLSIYISNNSSIPLQALDIIKSDSFKDPVTIRMREKDAPPELIKEAQMHPSNKTLSIYNDVNFPSPPTTLRPPSEESSSNNI